MLRTGMAEPNGPRNAAVVPDRGSKVPFMPSSDWRIGEDRGDATIDTSRALAAGAEPGHAGASAPAGTCVRARRGPGARADRRRAGAGAGLAVPRVVDATRGFRPSRPARGVHLAQGDQGIADAHHAPRRERGRLPRAAADA